VIVRLGWHQPQHIRTGACAGAEEVSHPRFFVVLRGALGNARAGSEIVRGLRVAVEQSCEIHVAVEAREGERLILGGARGGGREPSEGEERKKTSHDSFYHMRREKLRWM
jgi:hypothetical protein